MKPTYAKPDHNSIQIYKSIGKSSNLVSDYLVSVKIFWTSKIQLVSISPFSLTLFSIQPFPYLVAPVLKSFILLFIFCCLNMYTSFDAQEYDGSMGAMGTEPLPYNSQVKKFFSFLLDKNHILIDLFIWIVCLLKAFPWINYHRWNWMFRRSL